MFFTLGEMVLEVAGASLAAELAPVRLRGTYLALFGSCFGVAYGISPIVAGALLEAELPASSGRSNSPPRPRRWWVW